MKRLRKSKAVMRSKATGARIDLASDSRDFSVVEDSEQAFAKISQIVLKAGQFAAAEAKAAGLPRVFARDNQVIRIAPDGTETIIQLAERPALFYIEYPLATVLHARK